MSASGPTPSREGGCGAESNLRENSDAVRLHLRPSVARISGPLLRPVKCSQLIMATEMKLPDDLLVCRLNRRPTSKSVASDVPLPSGLPKAHSNHDRDGPRVGYKATSPVPRGVRLHRISDSRRSINTTTVLTLRVSPGRAVSSEPGRRDDRAVEVGARHVAVGLCVAGGVGPFQARWRSKSLLRQVMGDLRASGAPRY